MFCLLCLILFCCIEDFHPKQRITGKKLPAASLLPVVEQESVKQVNDKDVVFGVPSLFRRDLWHKECSRQAEGSQAGLSLTVSTRTSDVISVHTVGGQ